MRIVDAQIHLGGSGVPSNMAHRQVTSFTTEEAVGLMDEGGRRNEDLVATASALEGQ